MQLLASWKGGAKLSGGVKKFIKYGNGRTPRNNCARGGHPTPVQGGRYKRHVPGSGDGRVRKRLWRTDFYRRRRRWNGSGPGRCEPCSNKSINRKRCLEWRSSPG